MRDSMFTLKVGEIAHLGITTIGRKASVKEAVDAMLQNNLRDIIFEVDLQHRIFTVSDLLDYTKSSNDFSVSLESLPQHNLRKVCETEIIEDVLSIFDDTEDRYMGVTNKEETLIGIVSYSDVIGALDPSIFVKKRLIGEVVRPLKRIAIPSSTVTKDILSLLGKVENAVVIVDAEEVPEGILTSKDALVIIHQGLNVNKPVSEYMTTPVETVPETKTISQVLDYLQETGFKRAIVVDGEKKFLGAISQGDLAHYTLNNWSKIVHRETKKLSSTAREIQIEARAHQVAAYTDPLTKIGNRRKFEQSFGREVARINRYNEYEFSLILIDLDHFKKVNDEYGHSKGDEVLKAISFEINNLVRELDVFCRWGGEEFTILLPETCAKDAYVLAERIRELVSSGVHKEISCTISASVRQFTKGETPGGFMDSIDKALYIAKQQGRNRVEASAG